MSKFTIWLSLVVIIVALNWSCGSEPSVYCYDSIYHQELMEQIHQVEEYGL